mmetsp:Transcript_6310/g.15723  ORF Transcript_6310/g.15723 Transcript_6310/m.15723 type:complete len:237 (-) Transcript_6310:962-1672(-)
MTVLRLCRRPPRSATSVQDRRASSREPRVAALGGIHVKPEVLVVQFESAPKVKEEHLLPLSGPHTSHGVCAVLQTFLDVLDQNRGLGWRRVKRPRVFDAGVRFVSVNALGGGGESSGGEIGKLRGVVSEFLCARYHGLHYSHDLRRSLGKLLEVSAPAVAAAVATARGISIEVASEVTSKVTSKVPSKVASKRFFLTMNSEAFTFNVPGRVCRRRLPPSVSALRRCVRPRFVRIRF